MNKRPASTASPAACTNRATKMLHNEAIAQLMEEALRHEEFPSVEFRDSILGRQAYVFGSTLAVWEVLMVAETYALDPAKTAAHLGWPQHRTENVIAYIQAFPQEVNAALNENDLRSQ
jgi:hypothetical protein